MLLTMLSWEKSPPALDRTALVLESAQEAYVATDAAGRITGWNQAAQRTFGWTREEVLGRLLAETIVPERYRTMHSAGLRRYVETGEAHVLDRRLELEAVDRDGRVLPIEITISAVHADGEVSFHALLHL